MTTCGEALVTCLEAYGVDMVFGIPGVHTVGLYRGLAGSAIRHVTPRHEQGAGFMAAGYARATGRPGVCFLITGPGVTNAATALAQAYSDSVPVLAVSSVNATAELGHGRGYLHELRRQQALMAEITAFSHTLLEPRDLPEVLARAFAVFDGARPRPVHIAVPVDVFDRDAGFEPRAIAPVRIARPAPDENAVAAAARTLATAERPAVILGGGSVDAATEAQAVVEQLDAPVLLTIAAKGTVPAAHPLCLGSHLNLPPSHELVARSDAVLAVATELGETDTWLGEERLAPGGPLVRIDIDPEQLVRAVPPAHALLGDAKAALAALALKLEGLEPPGSRRPSGSGAARVIEARGALPGHWRPGTERHVPLLDAVRAVLPDDGIVATDSTRPGYSANHHFPARRPRTWLTSATGYGTLGYALPAAIGAKLGRPEQAVVCLVGDGGLLFTLGELACAVQERLALAVIVWNNDGYGEIREYMQAKNVAPIGVDLEVPDLLQVARGFGCHAARAESLDHVQSLLRDAFAAGRPTLIEIREDAPFLQGGRRLARRCRGK
jgi:acetolactate synthase-1/2/3 large subunit